LAKAKITESSHKEIYPFKWQNYGKESEFSIHLQYGVCKLNLTHKSYSLVTLPTKNEFLSKSKGG